MASLEKASRSDLIRFRVIAASSYAQGAKEVLLRTAEKQVLRRDEQIDATPSKSRAVRVR